MKNPSGKAFDLILEDGRYWINCWIHGTPSHWQNVPVEAVLALKGVYRLPLIGSLLRNFWAKRHGAFLDHVFHG